MTPAVGVVALAVAVGACTAGPEQSSPATESHELVVDWAVVTTTDCGSTIRSLTDITLEDESGKLIGTPEVESSAPATGSEQRTCPVTITTRDVPKASFYVLKVGNVPPIRFSYEEAVDANWHVDSEGHQ